MPLAAILLSLVAGRKQTEHHAPDVWAVVNGTEIKRDDVVFARVYDIRGRSISSLLAIPAP